MADLLTQLDRVGLIGLACIIGILAIGGALTLYAVYHLICGAFERGREATEDPERAALREYLDGGDDFNG